LEFFMVTHNPADLATELRLRAQDAEGEERNELLYLAIEYERMAQETGLAARPEWRGVAIPK
jgi:hypothetical protein|tara:strand:+ start:1240 stop:1425 length:186 start_codon:yes stop_codon:yes gene_type:complete